MANHKAFAFHDLLGSGTPIQVLARVIFLRSEDGGRVYPFADKYRPNHNFGSPDDCTFYIGQINRHYL